MSGETRDPRTARAPLSICILACNEEDTLERCLDSVAWAEEIVVVVDARSRDGSEKIARERAQRVEVRPYAGDIAQKSHCAGLARHDWVFILDPDEVVTPELAQEIREVVHQTGGERAGARTGYEVNRATFHLGRWLRHGDFYPDWKLRLYRRSTARWVGRDPHGRVETSGAAGRLTGELQHFSYRDLADQIERIQFFSSEAAASKHVAGERFRLRDLCLRPPARFLRGYVLKGGFRDGVPGFVVAVATAFHVFLKYAKLWELEQGAPPGQRSSR